MQLQDSKFQMSSPCTYLGPLSGTPTHLEASAASSWRYMAGGPAHCP